MKHYKNILTLISSLFIMGVAAAQVTFEVKVSKEKLGINERLRVEFTMNKDGDNFNPPNFEGFQVIGGPNQSISSSWFNGKKTYEKTYSYFLSPLSRGKFTIKQATIEVDGKIYKTLPIKIEVTAAVDKPSDEKTADDIANESLHLVAEVSNTNPYLNEAINVTYKLYISPSINVNDFKPLDNPKYNNFWSQDISVGRYKIANGTYKGKSYRYVVLKKVVLYPQKTGTLNIEPLSLDVTVDVPTNRRDIFGGRIYTQTHKTVSAGSRKINVKPLPEVGKPENFTGAVGNFNFNVTTSKTRLDASESLQAKVEITGNGNLKLFELPKLNLPSALEVYEPEFDEKIATNLSGMKGKVSDNYTIVPQFKGKYPIPAISFSYFDPKQEAYKTITSNEILIDVLNGPTNGSTTKTNTSGVVKQNVIASGEQFRFLKLNAGLKPISKKTFFKSKLYYALLLLPLLIIPITIVAGKKKKALTDDADRNRIKKANKLAKKYLSEAKKAIGKKEAFYVALEKALHNYLKAKLHIETSEFTKDGISKLLSEKNVPENSVENFIFILKSCELARYTPASEVTIQHDYNKAVETISQIDKHI